MKTEDFELYSWGVDSCGQLGLPDPGQTHPLPRLCELRVPISGVACGEDFSLLLTPQGQVFSVGSNAQGRLGIGDTAAKYKNTPGLVKKLADFKVVQIACGWGHSTALTAEGTVYAWGSGSSGALGSGVIEDEWSPIQMRLPGKAHRAACGARHTGIIVQSELYMCGSGDSGQLGNGTRNKVVTPVKVSSDVAGVSCGVFHSLILTKRGRVLAMGGNNYGQLGTGDKKASLVPVEVKTLRGGIVQVDCCHFSAAVNDRGALFVWGTGVFGEFLTPKCVTNIPAAVKEVRVGSCFAAALDAQGKLWTWGSNSSGELGLGDYEPRANPTFVELLSSTRISTFDCGSAFVLALGSSGRQRQALHESSALRLSQLSSRPEEAIRLPERKPSVEGPMTYRSNGSTTETYLSPRSFLGRGSNADIEAGHVRPMPFEAADNLEIELISERARRHELEVLAEDLQAQLTRWELELQPISQENFELKRLVDEQQMRLEEVETLLAEKDSQSQRLIDRIGDLERLISAREYAVQTDREAVLTMQDELRLRARDYRDRTLNRLKASPSSMRSEMTGSTQRPPSMVSSPRLGLSPQHLSRLSRAAEERTLGASASRPELYRPQTDRPSGEYNRLEAKHSAIREGRLDFKAQLSAIQQNRQDLKSRLNEIERSMRG
jgi:X-linked retinitis pigmentosa GTPase regulator